MKRIALIIVMSLVLVGVVSAQEETVKDWGIYTKLSNGATIDVPVALTLDKSASGFFANSGFKQETGKATDNARKLLRNLWDIPEIANMRYSTWQILLIKPRLVNWNESTFEQIDKAMTIWWKAAAPSSVIKEEKE